MMESTTSGWGDTRRTECNVAAVWLRASSRLSCSCREAMSTDLETPLLYDMMYDVLLYHGAPASGASLTRTARRWVSRESE